MTQSIFPFFHSNVDAAEFLKLFQNSVRTGVVLNSQVTAGSTGFKLSVFAGKVLIDGSFVDDDLDKLDGLDTGHIAGSDKHYAVYQTYAYTATDPSATSVFAVSSGAVPPTQPTIPNGAVKLADVFIPVAAASMGTVPGGNQHDPVQVTTTGVRIVQAPRVWPMQDTGELVDRFAIAGNNTQIFTDGAITYDDVAGKLFLTQPVVVQSIVTTNRQAFQSAPPLVRATIPSAVGGLAVPGSAGIRDVIVYLMVDRSVPNTALVGTLKFLNRTAPSANELNELLNYNNRTQMVIFGTIKGSKLFMVGGNGALPLADADNDKFLRNNSTGVHTWNLLDDSLFVGGHHAGLADSTARNAILAKFRKQGNVAYSIADDTFYGLIGGILDANWKDLFDDSRISGGMHVVANSAAFDALPLTRQKLGMLVLQEDTRELYRVITAASPPVRQRLFKITNVSLADTLTLDKILLDGPNGAIGISPLVDTDGLTVSKNGNTLLGGIITPYSAAISNALQRTHHSWVMHGCQLVPDIKSLGGGNSGPLFRVKAGDLVTAGGTPIHFGVDATADETKGVNNQILPVGPSTVYVYFRRTAPTTGEIRWSALPPDVLGQPSDVTLDGASVASDYCYLGFMRYLSKSIGTGAVGVWGKAFVRHLGDGRRIFFFDPEETALKSTTASSGSLADNGATDLTPVLDPTVGSGIGDELIVDMDFSWGGVAGARTGVTVTGPGINQRHDIFDSPTEHLVVRVNRSGPAYGNNDQNPTTWTSHVVAHTSGANIAINATTRLIGIAENVNHIQTVDA